MYVKKVSEFAYVYISVEYNAGFSYMNENFICISYWNVPCK